MTNEAALQLLEQPQPPKQLNDVSGQLSELFSFWLNEQSQDSLTLLRPDKAAIQLRFSLLPTEHEVFYMMMLEDSALHNQRLQQGILASLGRLTASIAHEIRNPLSAISHAGQLLSESPNLNPQDSRLTEIIQKHTNRMDRIINDILQTSKRQPSNREKILLDNWLPEYLEAFIAEQDLHKHIFELVFLQQQVYVLIDPGHLKQILDNLCLNALKYGAIDKGKIILQVSLCKSKPCIAVIDHGDKLSSEVIKHLFEPFFTTSNSGTGLGLYISRELAELNQAKLSYELTSEQQSSFKLCLSNAEQVKIEL